MWFNSMIREGDRPGDGFSLWGPQRGAAWLSSARAVRCRLKCHNERNPCPQLPAVRPGTLWGLPAQAARKAGMTSNQHGPYVRGDTRVTMAGHSGKRPGDRKRIPKTRRSSDRSLQLDSVKLDSLVIAHQPWRGEYVPGPCTKPWELGVPEVRCREGRPRVRQVTGAKS